MQLERVVIVTPDYPPTMGGIQELVWQVFRRFRRLRPEIVTLKSHRGGAGAEAHSPAYPPVWGVHARTGLHQARIAQLNARALAMLVRRPPAAIVSAHIIVAPAVAAASRAVRIPFLQYLHGEEVAARPRLAAFAVRQADTTVSVSSFTTNLVRERARRSGRIVQIGCGVDGAGVPAAAEVIGRGNRVITVARLTESYKGHDVMLRALPRVLKTVPDAEWWVVGDGPLRPALEAAARDLRVSDHVTFFGAVDNLTRDRLLDQAAIFAMPSRISTNGGGEGYGIVYLEAAAHGLPVLAANVGGAVDAVLDGRTGLLVDPNDEDVVAAGLVRLLTDRQLAERLGLEGRRHADRNSWNAVALRVEDLVADMIARRRPRRLF